MTLDQAIREASEAVEQRCLGGFVPNPSISREALGELIIAAREKQARNNAPTTPSHPEYGSGERSSPGYGSGDGNFRYIAPR